MNRAVLYKTARDAALLTVILVLATVAFETLFVLFIREVFQQAFADLLPIWFQRASIPDIMGSFLGADIVSDLSATSLMTIGFSEPLMYAFMWTLILTIGTRGVVGEIDRGTADLLLSLPVSRAAVYGSVCAVLALAAVLLSVAPLCGAALGQVLTPPKQPLNLRRLALLVPNLFVLNVAIGGLTMLISSFSSRRGRAIAVLLAVLFVSLLIQFLAPFWNPARRVEFLALLHYYLPLAAVRTGVWPVRDLIVLLSIGVTSGLVGLWRFSRRDIPAV